MIRRIHVQNFCMLRAATIELSRFRVLAGPAACGRSTLLGALQFVSDVVTHGASHAVRSRAPALADLCFDASRPIAFAAELVLSEGDQPSVRYELEIGCDGAGQEVKISREQMFVLRSPSLFDEPPPLQPALFEPTPGEQSIIHDKTPRGWHKVVAKSAEGRDTFWDERTDWHSMLRFGVDRSSLGSLPDDPERFPIAISVRDFLRHGIRTVSLDSRKLRAASPPGSPSRLAMDGSNLPLAVRAFEQRDPAAFLAWSERLKLSAPGLLGLQVCERECDKYVVLEGKFEGAHEAAVPQWCLSDALLRTLSLSLLPHHSSGRDEIYLIDEVEAGLHPRGLHAVFETLSAMRAPAQVLCSTSSPTLAGRAGPEIVTVLRRDPEGSTQVLAGEALPDKSSWFEA
jgi:hypothetical protein